MAKLNVVCWHWGDKYPAEYVQRLAAGFRRNLKQPHRFAVVSEDAKLRIDDIESWAIKNTELVPPNLWPSCVVRMRLFDVEWQATNGISVGDRIVDVDIDSVVTGPLDSLFDRPEPFVILQNINSTNPNPYNGSLWMVRSGYRPDAWTDFSLDALTRLPHHWRPSEQDWMRYKFPDAAAWGPEDGVYGFKKRGWLGSYKSLPPGAKLVTFPGRDPAKYAEVPWMRENWRM